MMMDYEELRKVLIGFGKKNVMVIGDVMLDKNVYGHSNRISPELPIPVMEEESVNYSLGGAANVWNNLRSISGGDNNHTLISIVGSDEEGKIIQDVTSSVPRCKDTLIVDTSRPTTTKTRFYCKSDGSGYSPMYFRLDKEKKEKISQSIEEKVKRIFLDEVPYVDAVILSDYDKGLFSMGLCKRIIEKCRDRQIPLLSDPKPQNIDYFMNSTILTPNLKEACKIAGIEYDGYSEGLAQSVASTIRDRFNQTHVFITCGGNGIYTYDGVMERGSIVETHTKNVIDVTGAGDTAIATIALAYCSGKSVKDCALIANLAAGVKVGKRGTDVVFQDEIRNAFLQWQGR